MSQPTRMLRALSRRGFIAGGAALQLLLPGHASAAANPSQPGSTFGAGGAQLFSTLANTDIPGGVNEVVTSGYSVASIGAASYVHDPAVNAAYIAANPRSAFRARDGRGFTLRRDHVTPFMLGSIGDGIADDTEALQAFADFVVNNEVREADASGRFGVSRTILWGKASGNPATTVFRGGLALRALAAMPEVLRFRNMGRTRWLGEVAVTGTGGSSYPSRTCAVGVVFQNCGRMHFSGGIRANRFHFAGASAHGGNNNLLDFGNCMFTDVGSGHKAGRTNYGLTGQWSRPSNSGGSASVSQRTTIKVTTMFPAGIEEYGRVGDAPIQVRINGYLYFVYAVDRAAGTAAIYPWLDPAAGSAGEFEWVLGAGLYLYGGDTNVVSFGQADCTRCGRGVAASSLYAPTADRIVTHFTGTALLFGRQPAGAVLGGHIRGLYCENNQEDICALSRQGNGFYNRIGSAYALNLAKCWATGDPRAADGRIIGGEFVNLPIPHQGRILEYEKRSRLRPNPSILGFSAGESRTLVYRRDAWTIAISKLDRDLHRLKGYSGGRLLFESPTSPDGTPTGAFTFNAPDGGSVNGGPSARFAGFGGPALFSVEIANPLKEAWTVRLVAGREREGSGGIALVGDADATLSASSKQTHICEGALTADRTLSLPPGGIEGRRFRIVRSADGAPLLHVNSSTGATLKSLSTTQWCELEDDGVTFRLIGSGSL